MKRPLLVGFTTSIVIVGAWFAAHYLRAPAPARWTLADLPELPPAHENAWYALERLTVPEEFDELVHDPERTSARVLLRESAVLRGELREHLASSAELRRELRGHSRFVEASQPLEESRVLMAVSIWKERSLSVLSAVLEGNDLAARVEAESMWSQSNDYTKNCRSLLSCLVGVQLERLSLGSAELVALGAGPSTVLAQRIEGEALDELSLENAVIAEYIYARVAIDMETRPFFDAAHTDRLFRRRFEADHAYAVDRTQPRPVRSHPVDAPLWWLYNARGKHLVEVYDSLANRIDTHARDVAGLVTQQRRIVRLLQP